VASAVSVGHANAQAAADSAAKETTKADSTVIVVSGFRRSYADAVAAKRRNVEITDSISSDGLGRFPDLNVGEALQRIPGVQLNREAGSRDATINLRGLPGEYARMTMNGLSFASPILTGSTPLGAFSSDIFSALAVEKSPMANAQAGGLSGNVDLQIAPALSRKDGGFAKVGYEYDDLGGTGTPNVTVGYNKHISDDFAVFGVLAYRKESFRRDTLIFNNYNALNYKTTPNFAALYSDYYAPLPSNGVCPAGKVCAPTGTGLKSDQGVLFMSQPRQDAKFNGGDLLSSSFGAEWRVNDHLKVGATGFYTRRNNNESVEDLLVVSFTPAATIVTPTGAPIKASDGTYVINDFNFSNAAVTSSSRSARQLQESWGVDGNIDWHNEAWRLSTVMTVSQADNHGNQVQMDFDPNPAKVNFAGSFSSGAGDFSKYSLVLNPNPATTNASTSGNWYWAGLADNPSYWYDTPTLKNN
jgi:TonB-dependent receptor